VLKHDATEKVRVVQGRARVKDEREAPKHFTGHLMQFLVVALAPQDEVHQHRRQVSDRVSTEFPREHSDHKVCQVGSYLDLITGWDKPAAAHDELQQQLRWMPYK
jgi:hypothetical protein